MTTSIASPLNKRAMQATGDFVYGICRWQWIAHLTFKNANQASGRSMFRTWLRFIAEEVARDHVTVAWGTENQMRGVPHYHALLHWRWNSTLFSPELGEKIWQRAGFNTGFAKITKYDHSLGPGGVQYAMNHQEWDLNVVCPRESRCRRKPCAAAPSPW